MIPFMRAAAAGTFRRIVAVTAAQSGKSECELDIIGHRLETRPAPIIYVGPTKQFVVEQFEPRLMRLLDEAPSLMRKVQRGKRMTKTRKVVAGVPVRLAHGGSSAALKSDPAAIALIDEYDEILNNVQGQGDPLGLVEARGDTYADFVSIVTSTPSMGAVDTEHDEANGLDLWKPAPADEIESPIWKLWQQGTRHHFAWQCPHCRDWFVPRFKLLRWPDGASPSEARRTAYVLCPHAQCGGVMEERHKAALNAGGQYIAPGQTIDADGNVQGDPPETSTASFWVSGLCSPFVSFGQRAEAFLLATQSGDREKIQTVINAGFGELWAPGGGEAPEALEVARLRLPYKFRELPQGVRLLTAGIDVQRNRLVYVIRGWGARATSWLIEHGELWGLTDEPEVWSALSDLLEQPIGRLRIRLALIDSGFRPNKVERGPEHVVYDFCRRHQRLCLPSKGYDTLRAPVILSKVEVARTGRALLFGLQLVRINTDWCKLWVHERIRWPSDQPGAFHLASDTSDDYCLQLVSEARIRKPSGRAVWVAQSRSNHYLDCEAMAYAAGYLLNVQRIREAKPHSYPTPSANSEGESLDDQSPSIEAPPKRPVRSRVIPSPYVQALSLKFPY
jgi:phage terminase large subunit GpA-like protein